MKRTAALGLGMMAVVTGMAPVLLGGCGKPGSSSSPERAGIAASEATASASSPAQTAEKPAVTPRRIIYSADITLSAESLAAAARDIEDKVKQYGGYVADSELGAGDDKRRTGTWKVRVPVTRFETFVKSLQGVGDIVSTKISSEDVSEEFYDVEARLRNKRAEEARLLLHLKASTAQLSDILAVERELSRVREEIERIQGRLRFLANQTDLTTITITVQEEKSLKSVPSFIAQAGGTFGKSFRAMGDFARGLTLVIIALVPWLLVATGIGLPVYLRQRQRRLTRSAQYSAPPQTERRNDLYEQ